MTSTFLNKTVLILDDDPTLVELFDEILNPAFTIKTAYNISDAMTLLQNTNVDAVISDYHLGAQNSDALIDWIVEGDSGLASRTILLTGASAITTRHQSKIACILFKPVDFDTLKQAVHGLFEQPGVVQQ